MAMPDPQDKLLVSHFAGQAAQLLAPPISSAADLVPNLIQANNTRAITSGRPSLDSLLCSGRGGWLPGRLYELAGAAGSGKTEFLYSMVAANLLALPPQSTIVWIDSVLGFSPQRLAGHLAAQVGQQLEAAQLSSLLNRVQVAQCPSTDAFFPLMAAINRTLSSRNHSPFSSTRLIILDSIHALLAPTVGDSSDQWLFLARQVAVQLKHLAQALSVPIIVTNNASRWNKRNKPALGQAWQHCVDEGLVLFEDEKGKRKVAVLKSGHLSVPVSVNVPFMNLAA
ncbi:P-loop containing nucleoside triphosphate hydrolase protein [Catenaria anguillulae PL171]|uniref:p-loop containing nucleoside triphosphate hydrolase protein n=1 Tax=Catenaria anguillulae PL171 TaxID=765915 RepID=A0A1Y2HJ80_9FUNG|nr:P-loop containing nucleoside triphosphate hydrolase protein [Catenaria anguillulae PL171]